MKKGTPLLLWLLLPALLAGCAAPEPTAIEQPLLWKISGQGLEKPSYLLGTIHIADPRIIGEESTDEDALLRVREPGRLRPGRGRARRRA